MKTKRAKKIQEMYDVWRQKEDVRGGEIHSKKEDIKKGEKNMATAIKAIPTLKGKEAREFLRHAEEVERDYKEDKNRDQHPFCLMAREILNKAELPASFRRIRGMGHISQEEIEKDDRLAYILSK